jgi:pimeloyl-ACP methyl ester carboxylesterase
MRLEVISSSPKSKTHEVPVLFVHGLWTGVWCWSEHFMDYFATQGFECHALSLRGHGKSEGNERLRWIRLSEYVEDVAQVISELSSPPILIGHSNGGAVVQKFLEMNSAPAAVLMGSVPPWRIIRTTLRTAIRMPIPFLKSNLTMSLYPLVAKPAFARQVFFSPQTPTEFSDQYFPRLTDESFLEFLDILLLNPPASSNVKTPVLVLGGRDDFLFPPNVVNATAQAYGTKPIIFPSMGHGMMLEPGWQEVADRIILWLVEHEK